MSSQQEGDSVIKKPAKAVDAGGVLLSSPRFVVWLIAAVVVTNLVVVGYGAINLNRSWNESVGEAQKRTRTIAYAVEQSIASNLDKIDISLQTVVNEVEEQMETGRPHAAVLQLVLSQQTKMLPETAGFRVMDAQGRFVAGVGAHSRQDLNVAEREYFVKLKANPELGLYISKPIISNISNEWIIPFARAYKTRDGHFGGVVSVPLSVEYFNRLLTRFEVGATGATALRDRDLGLIARFPPDSQGIRLAVGSSNISQAMRDLVQSGVTEKTYSTRAPYDGTVRVNTFHRIGNAPFFVIAGVGQDEFLQNWHRELWLALAFLFAFVLVTATSAWLIFRYWRQQQRAVLSLQESTLHLEEAVATISERDQILVETQQVGGMGTYFFDFAGGAEAFSSSLHTILGLAPDELPNLAAWQERIHPDDRTDTLAKHHHEMSRQSPVTSVEYRIVRKNDDAVRWVHSLSRVEYDAAGKPSRLSGIVQDVTERKVAEERLLLMKQAFQNSVEGFVVTDRDGVILEVNAAFSEISGFSYEEAVGQTPRILKSGLQPETFYQEMWQTLLEQGEWEGEFQNRRKDGSFYTQFSRISTVRNSKDEISRFICLASDVTELRESQHRIEYLAYHDKLTDLPNRALLADRLHQAIAQAKRRHELLGVCYLDLDNFKPVNDEWGHDIGDKLLIEVAQRLQACVRAGDTVARMGGDEFVVLMGNIQEESELELAVQRMLDAIAQPFQFDAMTAEISMSVGVTFYPNDDADDADALIRHADEAMYIAKRTGKNRMHLFDPESDRRLWEHQNLFSRVVAALENDEFRLYYQPKVDMRNGRVVGAEALIRWQHPEQGMIQPNMFLPVVEHSEFACLLGEWVIREALQQMRQWARAGLVLPVSVNIFGHHLQQADFAARLAVILAEYPDVKPEWLQLEILETTAMQDLDEISQLINECVKLGVSFALDDFGTGYSSLTYFRRLPVSLLKIDRSFVIDMLTDAEDYALVGGIIGLARGLQRRVIAEGLETIEHGIPLLQFGCDLAQGYGIAYPMPAAQVPTWVGNWQMPQVWRETVAAMDAAD